MYHKGSRLHPGRLKPFLGLVTTRLKRQKKSIFFVRGLRRPLRVARIYDRFHPQGCDYPSQRCIQHLHVFKCQFGERFECREVQSILNQGTVTKEPTSYDIA